MKHHIGAAMWIIASFVGFLVWWPIGAAFLTAITVTAIAQLLIGRPLPNSIEAPPQHRAIGGSIDLPMKQINYTPTKRISR